MDKIKSHINDIITNKNGKGESLLFILVLILFWRILKNNIILIIAIVYLLYVLNRDYIVNSNKINESFDRTGSEFIQRGNDRHDLRGVELNTRPIEYWIPERKYSCCKY